MIGNYGHRKGRWCGLMGGMIALISAGCQQSPYSRQNEKFRLDSLEWTGRTFAKNEADRPTNLDIAANHIDHRLQYNARQLRFNLEAGEMLAERDIREFPTKADLYRQRLLRLLWAEPDSIERTTITLFW